MSARKTKIFLTDKEISRLNREYTVEEIEDMQTKIENKYESIVETEEFLNYLPRDLKIEGNDLLALKYINSEYRLTGGQFKKILKHIHNPENKSRNTYYESNASNEWRSELQITIFHSDQSAKSIKCKILCRPIIKSSGNVELYEEFEIDKNEFRISNFLYEFYHIMKYIYLEILNENKEIRQMTGHKYREKIFY